MQKNCISESLPEGLIPSGFFIACLLCPDANISASRNHFNRHSRIIHFIEKLSAARKKRVWRGAEYCFLMRNKV